VILESGCGWLPHWLWHLDEIAAEYGAVDLPPLGLRPSEYFRRQCFVSADVDEPLLPQVAREFPGCVVTASDFPHPEGTFPGGVRQLCRRGDLPETALRAILWDNPRRLYGQAGSESD
jgi:hypothetical protein